MSVTNQVTTQLMAAGYGVAEHVVHDARSASDRGDDDVPIDGLGDVRGLVAHRVADVLARDAVIAHDRYGGVAAFVGVPVADAGLAGGAAVLGGGMGGRLSPDLPAGR